MGMLALSILLARMVYELDDTPRLGGWHLDDDRLYSPTNQNLEVKISQGSFPGNVAHFFHGRFAVADLRNFAARLARDHCQLCDACSHDDQFGLEVTP